MKKNKRVVSQTIKKAINLMTTHLFKKATVVVLMVATLFLVAGFGILSSNTKIAKADAWWNTSWQKRVKITLSNGTRAENLVNFPIGVFLNSSRISYSDFKASGADVRFVDADGTTVLDYEVERWDTSATSTLWVRVPQIDASSNTDYIYMYYGNSGASAGANPTGVWDSHYLSVLHMGDNPNAAAPQMKDSTSNTRNATSVALTATTTGIAGAALDLNGTSQYVQFASTTLPVTIGAGTVEVFYDPTSFAADVNGRYLFTKDKSGTNQGEWRLFLGTDAAVPAVNSKLAFRIECPNVETYTWNVVSEATPDLNAGWYSAGAVWDKNGGAGNMKLYWNGNATGTAYVGLGAGVQTATTTASPNCGMEAHSVTPEIGRNNGKATPDGYFNGKEDEFRISDIARSANWMSASYESVVGTMNTYATAEALDITAPVISAIASSTNSTDATVGWTTNELADSRVRYGTSSGVYGSSNYSSSLVTLHSNNIIGLSPSTRYYFVVVSADNSGNISTSTENTFDTSAAADVVAPVISVVASSTTSTTATISWTTDENSTSTVSYGATTSYGSASSSSAFVTLHSIVLAGLSPSTAYHFQVASTDASNNRATSSDYILTTTASTPNAPSALSAKGYDGKVNLKWTEPVGTITDYLIEYKTSIASTWTLFSDAVSTATSTLVTALTNNSAYDFRVAAKNGSLIGATSTPVTMTPNPVMFLVSPTISDGSSTTTASVTAYGSTTVANPVAFNFRLETSGGALVSQVATTTRYGNYNLSQLTELSHKQHTGLTSDLSGVVYVPTTDTLFTIHNNQNVIHEVSRSGANIRTITCSACADAEDITLISSVASTTVGGYDHTFMLSTEDVDITNLQIFKVVIHSTGAVTVDRTKYYSTGISSSPYTNDGLEGLTYNPNTDKYIAAQEGQGSNTEQPKLYEITLGNINTHSASSVQICTNLNFRDYTTDVYGFADISGLNFVPSNNHLYAVSHKGDKVLELDITSTSSCQFIRELPINMRADSGANHDYEMPEGTAWDSTGDYYYVTAESDYWSIWRTNAYTTRNTFSGLSNGTYNLYGSVTDADGITSTTTARSFTVNVDTTAPTIFNHSTSTASTSANISWNTDESATSFIQYGLTTSYGTASTSLGTTVHSVALSGLSNSSTYHYRIIATDGVGNTATSSDYTFVTAAGDITPPTISSLTATPGTTTASIVWNTNENASSSISYGLTTSYGNVATSSAAQIHSVSLSGLTSNTLYHYRAYAIDASGNGTTTTDGTFTTNDGIPPVISVIATSSTASAATVTWTTDELASSKINYGLTTSYGSTTGTLDVSPRVTLHSTTLVGLAPNTTYQFQIESIDASGNIATSTNKTVTTAADTTAPTISNVSSSVTSGAGTITWTTDELASSKIQFGVSTAYGSTTSEVDTSPRVLNHSMSITGLEPCTVYYYKAISKDASSNISTSSAAMFTTSGCTSNASVFDVSATPISTNISSNATLTSGGQTIVLDLPANVTSTSSSLTIQIKLIDDAVVVAGVPAPTGTRVVTDHIYDFKAYIDPTNILTTFAHPITVTLTYSDASILGMVESSLKMYRYDGAGWIALSNCSVNTSLNQISCETDHFSVFGLFGDSVIEPSGSVSVNNSGPLYGYTSLYQNQTAVLPRLDTAVPSGAKDIKAPLKNLALGMDSVDVKLLQQILNKLGFIVSTNGVGSPLHETTYFGSKTKSAITRFQKTYGITPVNGYFGPKTRATINSLLQSK